MGMAERIKSPIFPTLTVCFRSDNLPVYCFAFGLATGSGSYFEIPLLLAITTLFLLLERAATFCKIHLATRQRTLK